eukprot:scaffold616_cov306-Pavlova_lutheri.AAC.3
MSRCVCGILLPSAICCLAGTTACPGRVRLLASLLLCSAVQFPDVCLRSNDSWVRCYENERIRRPGLLLRIHPGGFGPAQGIERIVRPRFSTSRTGVSCFVSSPHLGLPGASFRLHLFGFLGLTDGISDPFLYASGFAVCDGMNVEQRASKHHRVCACCDQIWDVFHAQASARHQHRFRRDESQGGDGLSFRRIHLEHRPTVFAPRRLRFRRRGHTRHEQHVLIPVGDPCGSVSRTRGGRDEVQLLAHDVGDATFVDGGSAAQEHVWILFGHLPEHVHGVRRIQGGFEGFQSRVQGSTRRIVRTPSRVRGGGAHPQATDDPPASQGVGRGLFRAPSFLRIPSWRRGGSGGDADVRHPSLSDASPRTVPVSDGRLRPGARRGSASFAPAWQPPTRRMDDGTGSIRNRALFQNERTTDRIEGRNCSLPDPNDSDLCRCTLVSVGKDGRPRLGRRTWAHRAHVSMNLAPQVVHSGTDPQKIDRHTEHTCPTSTGLR